MLDRRCAPNGTRLPHRPTTFRRTGRGRGGRCLECTCDSDGATCRRSRFRHGGGSTSTTTSTLRDLLITGGGWVEDHNRFGFNARTNADGLLRPTAVHVRCRGHRRGCTASISPACRSTATGRRSSELRRSTERVASRFVSTLLTALPTGFAIVVSRQQRQRVPPNWHARLTPRGGRRQRPDSLSISPV